MTVASKEHKIQHLDTLKQPPPSEKLKEFRALQKATDNAHGMAYFAGLDGSARVAIKSLDGKSITTVPVRLSEDQYNGIMGRIIPIPETRHIMYELAVAYANRTPIMLEGGTAIGKTFAVNRFAELLYGPGAKIPDFYCNGQTDVSELMGKYVPAGFRPDQIKKISAFLDSDAGELLKKDAEKRGQAAPHEIMEEAALILGIPVQKGSFTFQLGVLPRAMTGTMGPDGLMLDTPDGPGCMLHIQEVGMAAPSVINALLKIRGEKGKLATDIQVHEDGGRLVEAGEGFFLVFSTNPPGKGFKERFDVDSALSRALVWKRLPDFLSNESTKTVSNFIFDFSRIERRVESPGAIIDLRKQPELGSHLAAIAVEFYQLVDEKLRDGEPGRRQRVPVTLDKLWMVGELLQNHQIPFEDKDGVNFRATLEAAIKGLFIDSLEEKPSLLHLAGLDAQAKSRGSLGAALLESLNSMLTDRVKEVEFRGKKQNRGEVIDQLSAEAFAEGQGGVDKARQIKEEAEDTRVLIDIEKVSKDLEGLLPGQDLSKFKTKGKS